MDSSYVATIRDLDGHAVRIRDFLTFSAPEERGELKEYTVQPEDVGRPDILALKIYGDPTRYPLLITSINKSLLDLEQGEVIKYYA